jgi:hypothetical protein
MNRSSYRSSRHSRSAASVFLLAAAGLPVASTGCLDASGPEPSDVTPAPVIAGVNSPLDAFGKGVFESIESVAPPTPPVVSTEGGVAHGVACTGPYRFHAFGTDLFVSAELGYPGDHNAMLRARTTEIGPWEMFDLCPEGNGETIIRSEANHLLVSAEFGFPGIYNGMLRARASVAAEWEHFRFGFRPQWYTIENAGNALLVSAEFAYSGPDLAMLRSRRAYPPGAWEMFD